MILKIVLTIISCPVFSSLNGLSVHLSPEGPKNNHVNMREVVRVEDRLSLLETSSFGSGTKRGRYQPSRYIILFHNMTRLLFFKITISNDNTHIPPSIKKNILNNFIFKKKWRCGTILALNHRGDVKEKKERTKKLLDGENYYFFLSVILNKLSSLMSHFC